MSGLADFRLGEWARGIIFNREAAGREEAHGRLIDLLMGKRLLRIYTPLRLIGIMTGKQ